MKKIIFTIDKLKRGGIQNVLIRYANGFSKSVKYNVEILLKDEYEKDNDMLKEFNREVKISYLRPISLVKLRDKHRENKKNSLISKVIMSLILPCEKFITKRNLEKFFVKNKDVAAIVDVQGSFWNYINEIKIPKIGMVHIDPKGSFKKNPKIKEKRAKSFNKTILISEDMVSDYLECYPFAKEKIVQIYNPIDIDDIKKKGEDSSELTLKELELLKEEYLIAVSMLNKRKARDELIKVFKNIIDKGFKEKLFILGDGPERKNLEQLVKELKLEDKVLFLGMKSNPFIWMKNAKFLVHPSYSEGFGYVLAEAMAVGCVSISYDCPVGPSDVLERGKSGILVEMGNLVELENAIETLLTNKEELSELKSNIEKRVYDFSVEKCVNKFEVMIDEL